MEKNLLPELTKEISEYKKFAFNKSLVSLALALILANVVQKFVTSISESLFMPIINYFILTTNGNWRNLLLVPVDGMNLEVGKLCGSFIEFSITTLVLYLIYSKIVKRINPDAEMEIKKI